MAANDAASQQMLLGQKLLEKLTIASKEDITDDASCSICHEAFFTGPFREMPMKAPCGHIFGGNSIQVWISNAKEPRRCPMCRKRVLNGRTPEEQFAWNIYDELSESTVRQPLEGPLGGDAVQWALKAESLWQQFCEDLVHSLEEIHCANEWINSEGYLARRIVNLATVDRFASRSVLLSSVPAEEFPDSYRRLCAHLDAIDGHGGSFLTPGEANFVWLAHQHRKITECYERLLERVKPRDA